MAQIGTHVWNHMTVYMCVQIELRFNIISRAGLVMTQSVEEGM